MKRYTKEDLIKQASRLDILEVIVEEISRKYPDSKKESLRREFDRAANDFIKDQRDVVLAAIKIK